MRPQDAQSRQVADAAVDPGKTEGAKNGSHEKAFESAQHGSAQCGGVRPVRPVLLWLFRRFIAVRRMRRQFRAVRLAFADRLPPAADGSKLIFYLNHPSWWDPLLCILLAPRFIQARHFYAPIEAESLRRYGILRNFGLFPVEIDTPRGAIQFLRAAEAILRDGHVLGLTPQGAFTDARVRPPALKSGLGALMARMERAGDHVTAVPVAIEYTFWNERLPEALVAIGNPLHTRSGGTPASAEARSAAQWTAALQERLAETQDELASLSLRRDERTFDTLLRGRDGTAGFYGAWQRLRGKATVG